MSSSFSVLEPLGLPASVRARFEGAHQASLVGGRVCAEHRGALRVLTQAGEWTATLRGRLRHEAALAHTDVPRVGDWVLVQPTDAERGVITEVLPRHTCLWRRSAGHERQAQVLVANVDTVAIVSALPHDVNLRRMERFLALVLEGGAQPVLVFSKWDLCPAPEPILSTVADVAGNTPVHLVSAARGWGVDELKASLFSEPRTVALLGASGAGKSTLINRWLGEEFLATSAVLEDGRGRHTTTHRQLLAVPGGGALIDTPGLREVGLIDVDGGLREAFVDVERAALECRFPDCGHHHEPGCAVQEAVARGELPAERVHAFLNLQRELAFGERQRTPEEKRRWERENRIAAKALRAHLKTKRGR